MVVKIHEYVEPMRRWKGGALRKVRSRLALRRWSAVRRLSQSHSRGERVELIDIDNLKSLVYINVPTTLTFSNGREQLDLGLGGGGSGSGRGCGCSGHLK